MLATPAKVYIVAADIGTDEARAPIESSGCSMNSSQSKRRTTPTQH
jgi:hypothetical protein